MIPLRLQQAFDTAREHSPGEVIQQPLESGETCLELWQDGYRIEALHLDEDMLEAFINLEACYRQQGASDSAVRAFLQLTQSG